MGVCCCRSDVDTAATVQNYREANRYGDSGVTRSGTPTIDMSQLVLKKSTALHTNAQHDDGNANRLRNIRHGWTPTPGQTNVDEHEHVGATAPLGLITRTTHDNVTQTLVEDMDSDDDLDNYRTVLAPPTSPKLPTRSLGNLRPTVASPPNVAHSTSGFSVNTAAAGGAVHSDPVVPLPSLAGHVDPIVLGLMHLKSFQHKNVVKVVRKLQKTSWIQDWMLHTLMPNVSDVDDSHDSDVGIVSMSYADSDGISPEVGSSPTTTPTHQRLSQLPPPYTRSNSNSAHGARSSQREGRGSGCSEALTRVSSYNLTATPTLPSFQLIPSPATYTNYQRTSLLHSDSNESLTASLNEKYRSLDSCYPRSPPADKRRDNSTTTDVKEEVQAPHGFRRSPLQQHRSETNAIGLDTKTLRRHEKMIDAKGLSELHRLAAAEMEDGVVSTFGAFSAQPAEDYNQRRQRTVSALLQSIACAVDPSIATNVPVLSFLSFANQQLGSGSVSSSRSGTSLSTRRTTASNPLTLSTRSSQDVEFMPCVPGQSSGAMNIRASVVHSRASSDSSGGSRTRSFLSRQGSSASSPGTQGRSMAPTALYNNGSWRKRRAQNTNVASEASDPNLMADLELT